MSVTTPAVPASTVAASNTSGQWLAVAITGGTLTSVVINGTQAGTTAGSYSLPPGGTISITYSVAPTWAWTDPLELGYTPGYGAENTGAITAPGYNPLTDLPYPAHAALGQAGLGFGVSN